jgi:anti-sigma regulatory factor (Ser/Thr protein kinase)
MERNWLIHKDHAGSEAQIASVFPRHYPEDNNIHIAISDFGMGIPDTVRRVKPEIKDDCKAIPQAVIDGFTSQSTPRNRGPGLTP